LQAGRVDGAGWEGAGWEGAGRALTVDLQVNNRHVTLLPPGDTWQHRHSTALVHSSIGVPHWNHEEAPSACSHSPSLPYQSSSEVSSCLDHFPEQLGCQVAREPSFG